MLTREVIGAALIALVFVIAIFIFFGVRKRKAKQEAFIPSPDVVIPGSILFQCLYVATVFRDRPLERVWAYGLGNRGKAEVGVSDGGVNIHRIGERGFSIPFDKIDSLTREAATIDRGVEARGLMQIDWLLGSTELTTSFRIASNQEEAIAALRKVLVK